MVRLLQQRATFDSIITPDAIRIWTMGDLWMLHDCIRDHINKFPKWKQSPLAFTNFERSFHLFYIWIKHIKSIRTTPDRDFSVGSIFFQGPLTKQLSPSFLFRIVNCCCRYQINPDQPHIRYGSFIHHLQWTIDIQMGLLFNQFFR